MRGICIDAADTATLKEGAKYFVFENGPNHLYVSHFDNVNSHIGCYRNKYFKVVDEESQPLDLETKVQDFDPEKLYIADLIYRDEGYAATKLKSYFLKPGKTHACFYHDDKCERLGGSYPLKWFSNVREYEPMEMVEEEKPSLESEQLSLF